MSDNNVLLFKVTNFVVISYSSNKKITHQKNKLRQSYFRMTRKSMGKEELAPGNKLNAERETKKSICVKNICPMT